MDWRSDFLLFAVLLAIALVWLIASTVVRRRKRKARKSTNDSMTIKLTHRRIVN